MLTRIRKAMEEKDQGFTLIELLVVIIIIGILAAIAIPVFLNQRKKGWDAQAKSDLRNMATAQETYLTDTGHYTTNVANLTADGFKESPDNSGWSVPTLIEADGTTATTTESLGVGGYCMAVQSKSSTWFYYNSTTGGLTDGSGNLLTSCP